MFASRDRQRAEAYAGMLWGNEAFGSCQEAVADPRGGGLYLEWVRSIRLWFD